MPQDAAKGSGIGAVSKTLSSGQSIGEYTGFGLETSSDWAVLANAVHEISHTFGIGQ